MTGNDSRPSGVTAAFWLLVVGAVLLMAGGLLTGTQSFGSLRESAPPAVDDETLRSALRLYRGAGALFAVAGAGLAVLAGRLRGRDPRFRRAAMTMALTIVVVVSVTSMLTGGFSILSLLSLLPIVVGALFLSRPAVSEWYADV